MYVREKFLATEIKGPTGVNAECVAVRFGENPLNPVGFVGYRSPTRPMAPFIEALNHYAGDGTYPFFGGGDPNARTLRLWTRRERRSST